MTGSTPPARWKLIAALLAVYIIWGSTYLGIRVAIETLPPFLMAGFRNSLAGLILYTALRMRGAPRPQFLHWRSAAIVGGLMLVGGNGGVTFAEQHIPSGLAALIIAATPLWMVTFDWLFFHGARPNRQMAFGLALGFVGVGLLIGPGDIGDGETFNAAGLIALLLAAITWAFGSLYSRGAPLPSDRGQAIGMEMLAGGGLLLVLSLLTGEWARLDLSGVSLRSLGALSYLVLGGSLVGFTAYGWLLHHTTPARAASYAYVNPVIAVLLGWALVGEPLTLQMMVAAAVIIVSVMMITSYGAQKSAPRAPQSAVPVASPDSVPAAARCGK